MKHWYILFSDGEMKCEFVSVSPSSKNLILRWPNGQNIKIILHDFNRDYAAAKNGEETIAFAIKKSGRRDTKPIKIIFK